ncbi:MAG: hypothetical protein GEU26_12815 [Nitrososphaeraceae archaeon]|nr:hypothetical protein [Nitrososphaeraceae archaeon]
MATHDSTHAKIEKKEKICFVISPIDEEGTDTRNYADIVFEFIIKPAVEKLSYKPLRADHISKPGLITLDIVNHLRDDALVVADLTESNPNVMYELAIRHAAAKHAIQIKDSSGQLPFDIQGMRTIPFRYMNATSMIACRDEISKQVQTIEANSTKVDSPISQSFILRALEPSNDPVKESVQQLVLQMQTVISKIDTLEARQTFHPRIVQPGEKPPISGQRVFVDPTKVILDPSQSLSGVVISPSLSNIKPTVLGGPSVFVDPTSWATDLKKKAVTEEKSDK